MMKEGLKAWINEATHAASPVDGLQVGGTPRIGNVGNHPISVADATSLCNAHVGLTSARSLMGWRREWWDHLRAAKAPEEKLTCERMINALNIAIGLNDLHRGAHLAQVNRDKQEQARAEEAKVREAEAIDRWR